MAEGRLGCRVRFFFLCLEIKCVKIKKTDLKSRLSTMFKVHLVICYAYGLLSGELIMSCGRWCYSVTGWLVAW